MGNAVQQLKREAGRGLFVGGVTLPLALAELGLIDEYEFVVQPRLALRVPQKLFIDKVGGSFHAEGERHVMEAYEAPHDGLMAGRL